MRFKGQIKRDEQRESYRLGFPSDLSPEQTVAWLRSVVGTLTRRSSSGFGRETFAFEVWASSREITHRLLVPKDDAEFVTQQLRTHGRGMSVVLDDARPRSTWTAVAELGMSSPGRQLHVKDHEAISAAVLSAMQGLQADEMMLLQWVITPSISRSVGKSADADFNVLKALSGYSSAAAEELKDRRAKLEEPNVLAVGRILARAQVGRAQDLVAGVESALKAVDSPATYLKRVSNKRERISVDSLDAATPTIFPAQLNLTELSALIAWPYGYPLVAGLHVGTSRQLPATEAVPRVGRVIGTSNFPNDPRPIAVSRLDSLKHVHIIGPTGSGKTTLLSNLIAQDMNDGYGVIMLEAKGDLFRDAKRLIPKHRLNDVVILDVGDRSMPVGFNILEQGNNGVVIDQLTELFQSLYPDTRGVWMRELLYYGLKTLAEKGGMTFIELTPLVSPRTTQEVAWAEEMRRGVRDHELKDFWARWEGLSKADQERNSSPLHNRIWQLSSRPELRHIIGQAQSSFSMDDIISGNKILLINLSGAPSEAASIAGTLIMNSIWNSVQRVRGEKPNYLYVDEFQDFIRLPVGAEDMLAKARGFGLGLNLAHQHLKQLTPDVAAAVMANARTKIVFTIEAREDAHAMQRAFGSEIFTEQDFQNLRPHEVVAKIATGTASSPVTLRAAGPLDATSFEQQAVKESRRRYGRDVRDVEAEIEVRRVSEARPGKRPPIGIREWGT